MYVVSFSAAINFIFKKLTAESNEKKGGTINPPKMSSYGYQKALNI